MKKDTRHIHLDDDGIDAYDLGMIQAEDKRQIKKWGYQRHSIWEWLGFITEELGELAEAIAEEQFRKGSLHNIGKEAVQVSTLALKMAIMIREWKEDSGIEEDTHANS